MRIEGPDTRYMMQWKGAWRPVTNMFDHQSDPTTLAMRAAKAVLYIEPGHWVACLVSPGEIVERDDRDPNLRDWEYID